MAADRTAVVLLMKAKEKAEAGVNFSPRFGALCPCCGHKLAVAKTAAWVDGLRERYHRCDRVGHCLLATAGFGIKSIEADPVGLGAWGPL